MIPDDEPWWKVRETADAIGDGYGGILCLPRTCPLAAEHQQAIKAEPASKTLQALDALPFRPIGYEW